MPAEARSLARATATEAGLIERLLRVLRTMGWVECRDGRWQLTPAFGAMAQSEVHEKLLRSRRAGFSQIQDLIGRARRSQLEGGLEHEDPDVFRATGAVLDADTPIAKDFVRGLVSSLDGALARLDSDDGRLLDVGCGVASFAMALCACLPDLHIVGVDPLEAPLQIARADISAAGLHDRVELRQQKVQALTEVDAFDMAFFPLSFIPEREIRAALAATWRALEHGAGLVAVSVTPMGDEVQFAMTWFRALLRGWSRSQRCRARLACRMVRSSAASRNLPAPESHGYGSSRVSRPPTGPVVQPAARNASGAGPLLESRRRSGWESTRRPFQEVALFARPLELGLLHRRRLALLTCSAYEKSRPTLATSAVGIRLVVATPELDGERRNA